jgi:hypothetical protein
VIRLWYLTALLHDVAYGIDVLKGARDLLGAFRKAPAGATLLAGIEDAFAAASHALEADGFAGFTAGKKHGEDHGVVAAHHLRNLLSRIAESDPTVRPGDYEPVVRAIGLHNARVQRVGFFKDPLAFLLILCDTVQEWARPQLSHSIAPFVLLSALSDGSVQPPASRGALRAAKVNLEPTGAVNSLFRVVDGQPLEITLEYSEAINVNSGVFNLWLDASCNLQRLDFQGLSVGVDLRFVTPVYGGNPLATIGPQLQLHRLRNAAREAHMAFITHWFPNVWDPARGCLTNGAVEHWVVRDQEHLVLHLQALSEQRPITRDIDEIRRRLPRWRYYSQDREYLGDYVEPSFE